MYWQYEFCPKCQGIQGTCKSIGLRKFVLPNDVVCEELLYHFHCASCNSYICSMVVAREELAQDKDALPLYPPPEDKHLRIIIDQSVEDRV